MQYKKVHVKYIAVLGCFLGFQLFGADVLKGDESAQEDQSFSFRIGGHIQSKLYDLAGSNFYVAAHPDESGAGKAKNFALAQVNRTIGEFKPLAPEKAEINGEKDQPNPLFDQGILCMSLLEAKEFAIHGAKERLVAVTKASPHVIYLLNNFVEGKAVVASSGYLPDAQGKITGGILDIHAVYPFVFAAVKANSGSFGESGSGIVPLLFGYIERKKEGEDAQKSDSDKIDGVAVFAPVGLAAPLDTTSDFIKINNALHSIGEVVDMHWDHHLGCLYIALRTKAGAGAQDGARAIVVGRVRDNNVLRLDSIAPTTSFDGANQIIGAVGSGVEVSAHKVRTMLTSTSLPYLVVLGGVEGLENSKRTVFALPLVSGNKKQEFNGTIAKKDVEPNSAFQSADKPFFVRNDMVQPATTVADMTAAHDRAAQVGGGPLLFGDSTDLFVSGDTVFVSVQNAEGNHKPGIFCSQAIFDASGKITGWTQWRRAVGATDKVFGFALDPRTGNTTFMVAQEDNNATILKRTKWSEGDEQGLAPLSKHIADAFARADGGVHGLFDFPAGTPGLQNISLLIATGRNKIVLAETGKKNGAAFIPYGGAEFSSIASFNNGMITDTFPIKDTKIISIAGGALEKIGPIVAAEVGVDDGTNGWLFVGGSGGLVALSHADGSGWNLAQHLATGFTGIVDDMAFKAVGNYQFVRKLVADGKFLYVLTDKQLDRIDLTRGIDDFDVTTLAKADLLSGSGGCLLDVVVSGKLALLGVSVGLFRVGNDCDIRTAQNEHDVSWIHMPLPEGIGPVTHIIPVSVTGRSQDFAHGFAGQVYVVSRYRGKNQTRLYRLAIKDSSSLPITNATVQLFPDLFVKGVPSYFASLGAAKGLFATDGACYLTAWGKGLNEDPGLHLLVSQTVIRGGTKFLGVTNATVPIILDDTTMISALKRSFASGSWLLSGNLGNGSVRVNE